MMRRSAAVRAACAIVAMFPAMAPLAAQVALAETEAGFVTARQQLGVSVATLEAVLGDSITMD